LQGSRNWEKYVDTYSLICSSDGTYGVKLNKDSMKEALRKIFSKSEVLESDVGGYYRLRYDDIEIALFVPTRTMILIALESKYSDVEEFLEKLFT